MNIVETIERFNKAYIYFFDPIKNNIMINGSFIRILYSTDMFVMNGIYLYINFKDVFIEKYYNKYKCNFDCILHKELIEKLQTIESDILKKANITNKIPIYKMYDQVRNGNIKFFSENIHHIKNTFLLKISGIWETDNNYRVTYKFSAINHQLKNISN